MTAAAPHTALTLFRDGKRPRPAAPSRGSCHGSCRSPQGYSAFPGCAVSGGSLQNRHVYDDREATRGAGRFRERPRGRGNIHPFSFCARSASGLVGTLLFLTLACGWAPLCLVCVAVYTRRAWSRARRGVPVPVCEATPLGRPSSSPVPVSALKAPSNAWSAAKTSLSELRGEELCQNSLCPIVPPGTGPLPVSVPISPLAPYSGPFSAPQMCHSCILWP